MNSIKKRVFEEIDEYVGLVLDSKIGDFYYLKNEFNNLIEWGCDENYGIGMVKNDIDNDCDYYSYISEQIEDFSDDEWENVWKDESEYVDFCDKTLEYIIDTNEDIDEFEKEVEEWKDQFMKSHINNVIERHNEELYEIYDYNGDGDCLKDYYMKYMLKSMDIKSTESDIIMKYYDYFLNKLEEKNGKEMIPQNVRKYVGKCMKVDIEWVRHSDVEKVLEDKLKEEIKERISYSFGEEYFKDEMRSNDITLEYFDTSVDDKVYRMTDVTYKNLMDNCGWDEERVNRYLNEIKYEIIENN